MEIGDYKNSVYKAPFLMSCMVFSIQHLIQIMQLLFLTFDFILLLLFGGILNQYSFSVEMEI